MHGVSLAVLGLTALMAVIVLAWSSTGAAKGHQQEAVDSLEEFLGCVDVDGDGVHTIGDRAVMEWWLSHGGSAQAVMSAAADSPGSVVRDATTFLGSPEAQIGH